MQSARIFHIAHDHFSSLVKTASTIQTTVYQGWRGRLCLPNSRAHVICVYELFFPRWKESVTRFTARDMGLGAVATHGHTGTRAHPGKVEATFIQEDKDASAEWGGAQFYKLPYSCHTQFSFTQNLALTRVNSEKGWALNGS